MVGALAAHLAAVDEARPRLVLLGRVGGDERGLVVADRIGARGAREVLAERRAVVQVVQRRRVADELPPRARLQVIREHPQLKSQIQEIRPNRTAAASHLRFRMMMQF